MAKVYLDANKVLDLAVRKAKISNELDGHLVFVSTLSIHILAYVTKVKIPDRNFTYFTDLFTLIALSEDILYQSYDGPTRDFEDNIQLHSAVIADADYFLTNDRDLLKMKFFGKAKIIEQLSVV